MRLFFIVLMLCIAVYAAPQSKLLFANSENNGKQFIEEVVVESVLHVKSPSGTRQARTNVKTNLQDGSSVAEAKN
ncbi:uncharacterized protein LOC120633010 [Pararge aegeria]|uniref:Jg11880 protein n=1 Tax=Pararge aegeria aegeria TaxID=348720 RepID=A0A8S4SG56_9NEOP|nr:uncharacterized protein LOC120633010 [Pararge aegeria]CAH2267591.1 jg11880 [Pararge aegeria aegeria]